MPGDKIGVQVSEKYVPDAEAVLGGKRDVLVSVALWIDDSCRAGRLVSNHVGGVRQARQIELFKDQGRSSPSDEVTSAGERSAGRAWEISSRPDTSAWLHPQLRPAE